MRLAFRMSCTIGMILIGLPVHAATTTRFDPELGLYYGYDSNVGYGGDQELSDEMATLQLLLPVLHTWRKGSLDFRYQPTLFRFAELEALDRTDHFLSFRMFERPNPRSVLQVDFNGNSTQVQGNADSEDVSDAFVFRRTEREVYLALVKWQQGFADGWRYAVAGQYQANRFQDIEGTDTGGNESDVEDRDSVALFGQLDHAVNPTLYIGVRVARADFQLEQSGDSETNSILFTYERAVSRKLQLNFYAGGFYSEGEAAGDSGEAGGFQGSLSLRRDFKTVRLDLQARHEPTAGGSLLGAATDSVALVRLSGGSTRSAWQWQVTPRYSYREPNDTDLDQRTSFGVGARIYRRITRQVRARLQANYINQTSDSPDVQDRDNYVVDLGFVWAPWRGTRMAGK